LDRSSGKDEVLLRVNEQRNILHEIRKRKANWIGHILRRNCLIRQVIEGMIKGEMEVTRRRDRKRKKLLDVLREGRGYPLLKEEALNRSMWSNRFGGGIGDLSLDRVLNGYPLLLLVPLLFLHFTCILFLLEGLYM
jgi:hypothetical protein